MSKKDKTGIVRFVCWMVLMLILNGCTSPPEKERINISQALSTTADNDCFAKAVNGTPIVFPRDKGAHEDFQTEWWYYTGNLSTDQKRHFGFQLTFFRQALSCEKSESGSQWRTRQLYFAHFAVTDTQSGQFYSSVRMNRQALDIAGAQSQPFQVWIDDWYARQEGAKQILKASAKGFSIQFELTSVKPVILQGEKGFSQKGGADSNASYYYSSPRLETTGTVKIDQTHYPVNGLTWFDHEWSTSALEKDVAGWDWFSAHLEDGRDLMICQIRKSDGSSNGMGFGSISFRDGRYEILNEKQFKIDVLDHWKSKTTGKRYPSKWQIHLPEFNISLNVRPVIPNQEHDHQFAYWEGAVQFEGPDTKGLGYVEMTGY